MTHINHTNQRLSACEWLQRLLQWMTLLHSTRVRVRVCSCSLVFTCGCWGCLRRTLWVAFAHVYISVAAIRLALFPSAIEAHFLNTNTYYPETWGEIDCSFSCLEFLLYPFLWEVKAEFQKIYIPHKSNKPSLDMSINETALRIVKCERAIFSYWDVYFCL